MDKNVSPSSSTRAGLIAAAVIALGGCGGGGSSSAPASTAALSAAKSVSAVTIKNYSYAPPSFTVEHGAKVTFTNADSTSHTATSSDNKTFDSGTIAAGKSATVSFDAPGTYTYYCRFHPFMKGTVTVK